MIVKANVLTKDGKRGTEWFLVCFDHTPVKDVTKHHRRTGYCSIFYLTDDDYDGGEPFSSRICGEKNKYFVTNTKLVCSEKDNYVKAYARNVTLKKAIQQIMTMQANGELSWDFTFDNETFKSFITTLNKQHPHGNAAAMKLLQNSSYRHNKK